MDLTELEQQRQALELNLQAFRTSLKHWQTWEADYEGLKEEIEATDPASHGSALLDISKSFDGSLITESEIRDIGNLDKAVPRTPSRAISIIQSRQEYVQKNIETIQRQYWDAEAKLEELDFAASSGTRDASGLPLTEIHEELDDDDNVVSSRLSHAAPTSKLVKTLEKAGLSEADLAGIPNADEVFIPSSVNSGTPQAGAEDGPRAVCSSGVNGGNEIAPIEGSRRPPIRKKSVSFSADTKEPAESIRSNIEDGRKFVSFAPKIPVAPAALPPDARSVSFAADVEEIPAQPAADGSIAAKPHSDTQKQLRTIFKPGEKVGELNDEDELAATHIVIPEDESEEDAQMRRDMLEYHLNEVGHVVAQLDLDGDDYEMEESASISDFTSSEHQDEDTPYTSGMSDYDDDEVEDEDEDEFGRTKRRVISDSYHKQMRELEQRLIGNLGPAPTEQAVRSVDPNLDHQDVRRLVIREKENAAPDSAESKPINRKRVSFAEALDVAEPGSPPLKAAKTNANGSVSAISAVSQPAHAAEERNVPIDRAGTIVSETLLERVPPATDVTAPSLEDPDSLMQRRELAAEYYRRRNDMIRSQGGFKASATNDEEEEHGELMEEKDGKVKKVSRFRAARLKAQDGQS